MWSTVFTLLLGDSDCLKPFLVQLYSLGFLQLSGLFVSLCLGWEFSHLFVVSSEFLLGICVCCCLLAQLCPTLCHPMDCKSTRLVCPWAFSRQECWSGLQVLLQGVFLTQRWNLHLLRLLHCRRILYHWAEIYLMYKKPTLIMKIHNQWKVKMVKPKSAFIL